MTDLIIRAAPADLEELRRQIELEMGREARLQPVTDTQAGQLREPILIALIVALGGGAATKAVADVIKRFLKHGERMQELTDQRRAGDQDHQFRMSFLDGDTERPATLDALTGMAE